MNNPRSKQVSAGPALLDEINKMLVLREMWLGGPLSRAELSRRTGLSKPTISKIVYGLLSQGMLEEAGWSSGSPRGGRRAELLRYNPEAGFVLVCVVHEGHLEGALGNCRAQFLERFTLKFSREAAAGEVIADVIEQFELLLERNPKARERLMGVAVSLPGVANVESGKAVFLPGMPTWTDFHVAGPFEQAFDVAVYVENENRLMATAEYWFGAAQGVNDFVSLSIGEGSGTGGAVFMNGQLWRGVSHLAGEVGHMRMQTSRGQPGPPINSRVAVEAFLDRASQLAVEDPEGTLARVLQREGQLGVGDVFQAARDGDETALRAVSELGHDLGFLIGNVLLHYDVPLVVLHCDYTNGGRLLLDVIDETLDAYFLPQVPWNTQICYSDIREDIELIGATGALLQYSFTVGASRRRGRRAGVRTL